MAMPQSDRIRLNRFHALDIEYYRLQHHPRPTQEIPRYAIMKYLSKRHDSMN